MVKLLFKKLHFYLFLSWNWRLMHFFNHFSVWFLLFNEFLMFLFSLFLFLLSFHIILFNCISKLRLKFMIIIRLSMSVIEIFSILFPFFKFFTHNLIHWSSMTLKCIMIKWRPHISNQSQSLLSLFQDRLIMSIKRLQHFLIVRIFLHYLSCFYLDILSTLQSVFFNFLEFLFKLLLFFFSFFIFLFFL